jgi:hypothetical protein
MKFETFVNSKWNNYWIKEGTLQIYVRKTPSIFKDKWGDFQLASLVNEVPGHGDLKIFLDKWEKHYQFYIENVLNPRLERFLLKRQYVAVNKRICLAPYPPCMLGPDPAMIGDLFRIVKEYHSGDKHD